MPLPPTGTVITFDSSVAGGALAAATIPSYDNESVTSAIPTTALIPQITASGMYLVSVFSHILTPASGGHPGPSSTLGPLTLSWTDDDGGNFSAILSFTLQNGAVGTVNSGNAAGDLLSGSLIFAAQANTPINFSFGYASQGTVPMVGHLHIKSAYLGAT